MSVAEVGRSWSQSRASLFYSTIRGLLCVRKPAADQRHTAGPK